VKIEERVPDYYLVSSEGYDLHVPRRCWRISQLRLPTRDDLLLVRVAPPIIHENKELEHVILAARHAGYTINQILEWPLYVHVITLKSGQMPPDRLLSVENIVTIAWAELYQNEPDARAGVKRSQIRGQP
jgi:hypothetical protein